MLESSFNDKESFFLNQSDNYFELISKKFDDLSLKKIKLKQLLILRDFLYNYKPKSKIRSDRELFLNYIKLLSETDDIGKHNYKQISELEKNYIHPIVNKFSKDGFTIKGVWLTALFFLIPLELLLCYFFIKKFNLYFPLITVYFLSFLIRDENKAKKENKLW